MKEIKQRLTKSNIIIISLVIVLILGITLVYAQNNYIGVTKIELTTNKLGEDITLLQISDLHTKEFGKDNKRLIQKVKGIKPDIIVITGDIVDVTRPSIKVVDVLSKGLVEIAPVYYVNGNHEYWIGDKYKVLEDTLIKNKVKVLRDRVEKVVIGENYINIIGMDDLEFIASKGGVDISKMSKEKREETLGKLLSKNLDEVINATRINREWEYNILLYHRPDTVSYMSGKRGKDRVNIDLLLSGHVHGGQFRIPFLGGLYAPNQGFLPEYDSGKYKVKGTNLVVSRGLGNSRIPLRINNYPELVEIRIK